MARRRQGCRSDRRTRAERAIVARWFRPSQFWLGDLAWGRPTVTHVEFVCRRCPRHGRLKLAGLIDRYGPTASLIEVADAISADCPRHGAPADERCIVVCPQLLRMIRAGAVK